METAWDKKEMQALGEKKRRLILEAAEKSKGKSGMERLDVFLEYGEKLAAEGDMTRDEQKALLAAIAAALPQEEQNRLAQILEMLGI